MVQGLAVILLCRPKGRGNWALRVITYLGEADLFRFVPGHVFTWGDPPETLRIVEVRP